MKASRRFFCSWQLCKTVQNCANFHCAIAQLAQLHCDKLFENNLLRQKQLCMCKSTFNNMHSFLLLFVNYLRHCACAALLCRGSPTLPLAQYGWLHA